MSLSKMLQEYREGLRGLPTYEELMTIASSAPMTPERFAEKMDELDKANPAPLARLMAATQPCADPIVERNVSLLRERSTVGVQKYGTTLADNKLPLRAWLNHALEEALDQANYLQAAMAEIDSAERALPPLPQYSPDVKNIKADEELRAQQYAQDYARSALAASPVRPMTTPDDTAKLKHEHDTLAKGIADAALKAGIWNGEVQLSGPHLLMMLNDMAECLAVQVTQSDAKSVDWMMCERISNEDHVDEALRAFSEDSTQDNAAGLIQAALTVYLADIARAAPVQAQEQGDIPVDIPKSIPEKDHYVYLRGYYDGERATIAAKASPTPK